MSKRFYENYPNLEDCSIQYFDDTKTTTKSGKLPYTLNNLKQGKKLNKQNCGIFFSVNSMITGKRDQKSVTHINSRICEIDELSKANQLDLIFNSPIPPSCVVESKKSYHLYWFAIEGTIDNRKTICLGLAKHFGGDKKVCEISRVLRLPGYNHCKDPDDQFKVTCVFQNGGSYTEKQMLEAFPYEAPKPKKRKVTTYDGDNIRHFLNDLDNIMMLERLSCTSMIDGDKIEFKQISGKNQIIVDGKTTPCRIREDGTIGSPDDGGPTRINRIQRYGKSSNSDILRRAKDNCSDIIPEKYYAKKIDIETTKSSEFDQYVDENINIAGTYGLEGARETFGYFYEGDFVVIGGYQYSGKTTFVHHIGQSNAKQNRKVIFFSLEMSREQILTRRACQKAGVMYYEFAEEKENHGKYDLIKSFYEEQNNNSNYHILGVPEKENRDISKLIQAMKDAKDKGYKFFMIDSLSKVIAPGEEVQRYAYISDQLRNFATNNSVCVILIHHMGKPNKLTGMTKPGGVSGFRGTHKIADESTKLVEYRRDQENESSYGMIIQYKDTLGSMTGKTEVLYRGGEFSTDHF